MNDVSLDLELEGERGGWVLVQLNHLGNFKEIQIVIMRAFDFEVRISQGNRNKTMEDKLIFPPKL